MCLLVIVPINDHLKSTVLLAVFLQRCDKSSSPERAQSDEGMSYGRCLAEIPAPVAGAGCSRYGGGDGPRWNTTTSPFRGRSTSSCSARRINLCFLLHYRSRQAFTNSPAKSVLGNSRVEACLSMRREKQHCYNNSNVQPSYLPGKYRYCMKGLITCDSLQKVFPRNQIALDLKQP